MREFKTFNFNKNWLQISIMIPIFYVLTIGLVINEFPHIIGKENIDVDYAKRNNIKIFTSPEGNSNAVGEHALGLLLSLMNKIIPSNQSIKQFKWLREKYRGYELENKIIGII